MAQAIRLLIDGHQFDDLAREIPHLIDKVNDRPDDKQAADNLREVAVGALDRYRRFADQYQYWVESETDVGRRRGLYKVVLDFWRLVRDASDALKNARHRTSFLHVTPPRSPRPWISEDAVKTASQEGSAAPAAALTAAKSTTPCNSAQIVITGSDKEQIERHDSADRTMDAATPQPDSLFPPPILVLQNQVYNDETANRKQTDQEGTNPIEFT